MAMQTKLSRTQIVKIIIVCIHKYVRENWENFYSLQKKEERKVVESLQESEAYKKTCKFMKDMFMKENPTLKYYEINSYGFVSVVFGKAPSYNDLGEHHFTFSVPAVQQPKPKRIEILGIEIAAQYISDSWEQKMRARLNNRINEIEVESLLKNKKFTLDLNEFMSKIGLPAELCTVATKQLQAK